MKRPKWWTDPTKKCTDCQGPNSAYPLAPVCISCQIGCPGDEELAAKIILAAAENLARYEKDPNFNLQQFWEDGWRAVEIMRWLARLKKRFQF